MGKTIEFFLLRQAPGIYRRLHGCLPMTVFSQIWAFLLCSSSQVFRFACKLIE